jgi:hypothetical protein
VFRHGWLSRWLSCWEAAAARGYQTLLECLNKAIKKPLMLPSGVFQSTGLLLDLHFVSLHAFLALHSDKADFLAFFQALETVALDCAKMHEQIRAAFLRDETKPFLVVKPLYGTVLTIRHAVFPCNWS